MRVSEISPNVIYRLYPAFPERAEQLFKEAEEFTAKRYASYKVLAGM